MSTHRSIRILSATLLLLTAPALSAATPQETVQPVSPGDAEAFPTIEGRCPTFSWTADDEALGYELVAYLVSEREELLSSSSGAPERTLKRERHALRVRLPAKASSWTPSGDQCLAPGESYAWAVRALTPRSGQQWSDVFLFEVQSAPDQQEVKQALETLERYLGRSGSIAVLPSVAPPPRTIRTPFAVVPLLPGPIPTITGAGITTELADTTGTTAGLVARSNSPNGIGAVVQNTGTDGQIASFQNATNEVVSVAGDGTVDAVKFVGDGSGLTNLPGGGGDSPIAVFTSNTSPPAAGGTVATVNVTAPTGGCTLLAIGTVDLDFPDDDWDEPTCEIQVDTTTLTGSEMTVTTDLFIIKSQCVSAGGIALAAGMHTIDFVVAVGEVDPLDVAVPDSATLWALCVP